MQLLRERCINSTWNQMEGGHGEETKEDQVKEGQQRACKSIQSDKLIYNYAIRKTTPAEKRIMKHLILQRKIELRHKLERME